MKNKIYLILISFLIFGFAVLAHFIPYRTYEVAGCLNNKISEPEIKLRAIKGEFYDDSDQTTPGGLSLLANGCSGPKIYKQYLL